MTPALALLDSFRLLEKQLTTIKQFVVTIVNRVCSNNVRYAADLINKTRNGTYWIFNHGRFVWGVFWQSNACNDTAITQETHSANKCAIFESV